MNTSQNSPSKSEFISLQALRIHQICHLCKIALRFSWVIIAGEEVDLLATLGGDVDLEGGGGAGEFSDAGL